MRQWMLPAALLCAALLSALLGGCAGPEGKAPPEAAVTDVGTGDAGAPDWSVYEPYGLSYDEAARRMTYEGKRVRYFEDLYPVDWDDPDSGASAGLTFFDEAGEVDVLAERDLSEKRYHPDGSYDPSGVLLGLSACSQAEFDARDLEPLRSGGQSTASAGEPPTPEELTDLYAPYAAYGLTYDPETDTLSYEGRTVRSFQDILTSNGETPESGRFQGTLHNHWADGGTVDVEAVRNYEQPDADGNGTLTGLRVRPQAEFDARTEALRNGGGYVTVHAPAVTDISEEEAA